MLLDPTRRRRGAVAAILSLLATAAPMAFAPSAAPAAVLPGHLVTILTDNEALELTLDPNTTFVAELIRNGTVVGLADGADKKTDSAGLLNVNLLAGDPCWTGSTPDVLPGDTVRITSQTPGGPVVESMVVQDIRISQHATQIAPDSVQLKGIANTVTAAGAMTPITDVGVVDVRLISKGGRFANRSNRLELPRDSGSVVLDPAVPGGFIATFTNLTASDVNLALAADNQVRYVAGAGAGGLPTESSITGDGQIPGPAPGCPAGVNYAVTTVNPAMITSAPNPVTLSGPAGDATSMTVLLTDGVHSTTPVAGAVSGGTWNATIPATTIAAAALNDGTLTARGTFNTPAGPVTGATKTLAKDTTAPVLTMSPAGGTFTAAQLVSLASNDANAVIRFTRDGTVPTAASPAYTGPFSVNSTQRVQAIATDAVGNVSPVTVADFTINAQQQSQQQQQQTQQVAMAGYRLVAADGGIFTFGNAPFAGSTGGQPLNAPIITAARTPSGNGYWLVARDGGIFSFGDAQFFGSTGGLRLNQPIVGMAATPTGHGYWLVARDGGIFSFGDAAFFGSTGGFHLNQPIITMAATPSGNGYWLVARDGGIFAFGDAQFLGSTGGFHLNQPIITMAATPSGHGYWLVARDGGIFALGDAAFLGSTGGLRLNQPIIAMNRTASGNGYWLVAADGGIFSFGDAQFFGSTGGFHLNQPIIGMV